MMITYYKDLDGPAFSAIEDVKQRSSRSVIEGVTRKLHWTRMVGYGPFSLCVIHKERLCPTSDDDDYTL
jgi:hypothetical protein